MLTDLPCRLPRHQFARQAGGRVGLALLLDRDLRGMSVLRAVFILLMMVAPVVVGLMWRYSHPRTVGVFNRTLTSPGFAPIL